jgi:hypothetical protein
MPQLQMNGYIKVVCLLKFLFREKPDAIFFQEVIPKSLELLKSHLFDYDFYIGK